MKKENLEIEVPPHNNPSYRVEKQQNFLGLYKAKSDQKSDAPRKFDLNQITEEQFMSQGEDQSEYLSDINQDESMRKILKSEMQESTAKSKSTLI